jgi:hypothetical protein
MRAAGRPAVVIFVLWLPRPAAFVVERRWNQLEPNGVQRELRTPAG